MKAESNNRDLKKEIDTISKQISDLLRKQKELVLKDDKEFLEQAKSNIGRCFYNSDNGVYAKVIDVPRIVQTMSGYDLNRYQFPAIFIGENEDDKDSVVPIYMGTIFSGAWGVGYDLLYHFKEIPREEFESKFVETLQLFQKQILSIDYPNERK